MNVTADSSDVPVTACFLTDTIDAMCEAGRPYGATVQLVKRVFRRAFGEDATLTTACLDPSSWVSGDVWWCDVVAGRLGQGEILNKGFVPSVAYDADPLAIMFRQGNTVSPWAFLSPFSPWLWVAVVLVVFLFTPLVSSFIEYDDGESFVGNMKTYVVESVHAYSGVDTLYHMGDVYSKESAFLAAVVAIVSRVLLAVYGCNLAAFIITQFFRPTVLFSRGRFASVATARDFNTSTVAIQAVRTPFAAEALDLYRNGTVESVAASYTYLAFKQLCGEEINIVDGPYMFLSMAYTPGFGAENERLMNWALAIDVQEQPRLTGFSARYVCPRGVQAVSLQGVYGVFLVFGVALCSITALAVAVNKIKVSRARAMAAELSFASVETLTAAHDEKKMST